MQLKEKIQVTVLSLLLFLPLNLLLFHFAITIKGIYEGHLNNDIDPHPLSQSLKAYYAAGRLLTPHMLEFNLFISAAILLFMFWLWGPYFSKKTFNIAADFFNWFYLVLFIITVYAMFESLQSVRNLKHPAAYNAVIQSSSYLFAIIVMTYIETIWRFSNKSTVRKYLNSFYLIFGLVYWYDYRFLPHILDDSHSLMAYAYGLALYIFSLFIALGQIIHNRFKIYVNQQAISDQKV